MHKCRFPPAPLLNIIGVTAFLCQSPGAHADEVSDGKLNLKSTLPITFSGYELKPSIEGSITTH